MLLLCVSLFGSLGGFLYGWDSTFGSITYLPMLLTVNSLGAWLLAWMKARHTECRCVSYNITGAEKYVALPSLIAQTCRYDLALISGALSEIRDHFGLSEVMEEVIVGAAKMGAFFGTFLGKRLQCECFHGTVEGTLVAITDSARGNSRRHTYLLF